MPGMYKTPNLTPSGSNNDTESKYTEKTKLLWGSNFRRQITFKSLEDSQGEEDNHNS